MPEPERVRRAEGLQRIVTSRDPGDWIDEQLADIRAKPHAGKSRGHPQQRPLAPPHPSLSQIHDSSCSHL